ncbi:MAG: hypothetical protein SFU53_03080 [Terrimicrobiaceae bacterium]|nr:hypothetical protein [Terrimicrobiaceae bacterium]
MSSTKRSKINLLFAAALLTLLAGCATDNSDPAARHEPGSTLPWNRPESWEGSGMMGSMMPGSQ